MTSHPLPERIAEVLTPHLGPLSADAVARHVCAKYGVTDEVDPGTLDALRDFLQRGLVAFVGPEKARTLAEDCVATPPT